MRYPAINIYSLIFLLAAFLFSGCQQSKKTFDDLVEGEVKITLNPYERVPLGAQIDFRTTEICGVELEVEGRIPVKRSFDLKRRFHQVPLVGLYPDTVNRVNIKLITNEGEEYSRSFEVKTDTLPSFFPEIEIVKADRSRMEPGFHLVELLIAKNGKFLPYTVMFDDDGKVRWFMDMSFLGQIGFSAYRIRSGNWLYLSWIGIYEMSELGQMVNEQQMWGNAGSHEIIELPNGDLLMGGSKKDSRILRGDRMFNSRYDFVVEWNREGVGKTVREWDLRDVLDVDRMVFPPDYSLDSRSDWFHINSVAISPKDNCIVVSGRNQGVVKVDMQNNLKWILAPHRAWGKAGFDGTGFETSDYLLTAVDTNGNPFPANVQLGIEGRDDFEWSTGQHALNVMENGHLLLFDNGLMRNFDQTPTYSRAVEYAIDENDRTIRQVWEYGKERGLDLYSPITSDVDILPETGNRLITAGTIRKSGDAPHAKMVEVTYPDKDEVFEAKIIFKDALGTGEQVWAQFDLVFRGERYPLFSQE